VTFVLRVATMADAAQIWAVRYAVQENTLTPGRLNNEDLRREIEDTEGTQIIAPEWDWRRDLG